MYKIKRLWVALAGVAALVGVLTLVPSAFAVAPDRSASGTYSYGPEPTGIVCGSGSSAFEVFDSATVSYRDVKFYDKDGILIRDALSTSASGQFSNPLTGATVRYTAHQTTTFVQTILGDFTSPGLITVTGEMHAVAPGMGAVLVNAGQVVDLFNGETDTFLKIVGRQDLWDYGLKGDTSAIQGLCTALGAT